MNENERSEPSARQTLIGGGLAVALGVAALAIASRYPLGSLLRMGPGLFPCLVAALIAALGLVLIIRALVSASKAPSATIAWRSLLAIGFGIALFALLLERAGLVPATLVLVLASSLAQPQWRPWRAAVLAIAVTAMVYLLFVVVLQIPVAAVNL
jgi:hypothetical protein